MRLWRFAFRFQVRRLGLLLGLLLPACSEDATGPRPVPVAMVAVGGDAQVGTVGRSLDTALSVFITDKFGEPVPGVLVRFAGGPAGSLTPITQTTGPEGHASARWTLPTIPGVHAATVRVSGLDSLVFHAVAVPAPPASLSLISGDLQSAATASAVATAVVVLIRDGYGNPVGGTAVSFVPAPGSGSVEPAGTLSDSVGLARATWTLGEEPGLHELIVHVDTLPPLTVRAHALRRLTAPQCGLTFYFGAREWRVTPASDSTPGASPASPASRPASSLRCWHNALGEAPLDSVASECTESPAY